MITMGRHRSGAGGARSGSTVKSASLLLSPSSIHFLSDHQSDIMSHALSTDLDRNISDITRKIAANGDFPKIQAVQKDGHWYTLNNSQLELCRRLERDGCCRQVKVDVVALTEVPVQLRGMMVLPSQSDRRASFGQQAGQGQSQTKTTSSSTTSTTEGGTLMATATVVGVGGGKGMKPSAPGADKIHCPPKPPLAQPHQEEQVEQEQGDQQQNALTQHSTSIAEGAQDVGRSTGKGYQKLETADPGDKRTSSVPQNTDKIDKDLSESSDDSDNSDEDDSDSECEYECQDDGLSLDWSQDEADSSDGNSSDDGHSTDDERECLL